MKSGFASGAIAGFFAGIVAFFSQITLATIGLQRAVLLEVLPSTATIHLGYNTIWGAIFGLFYMRFYDVIPGKGIKKGFVYGLILYTMIALRITSYALASRDIITACGFGITGGLYIITYGLLQGFLYKVPIRPMKTEYNLESSIFAGTIGGLISGIVAFIFTIVNANIIGLPFLYFFTPITPITNVAATIILLGVVWGIVYSPIYALLFDKIPGKRVSKGFYYGLMLWLISTIRSASWALPYIEVRPWATTFTFIDFFAFLSYGLVLGYLYKPTK